MKYLQEQEVLRQAVRKATENGFDTAIHAIGMYDEYGDIIPYVLIYDHDFAKALWGDQAYCRGGYHIPSGYCRDYPHGYKQHLQQMVIADDPIEYIKQNI